MLDDDDEPDLDQLLDLATPWCLRVAATLRLPGLIDAGHHDIADLAVAARCDRDALHAVLGIDMLVAGGKTSTITQFTELAKRAGLDIAAARTQASGRYVVECRPKTSQPHERATEGQTK